MATFFFFTTIVLFILISLILILLVLIQKGRGGGLSGAFGGGGGGGNTAFGATTGDVLTWATSVVFGLFLLLAVVLNLLANNRHQAAQAALQSRTPEPVSSMPDDGTGLPLENPGQ